MQASANFRRLAGGALVAMLIVAGLVWLTQRRAPSPRSVPGACGLSEVPGTSRTGDFLYAVTPYAKGVVAVGTRFTGGDSAPTAFAWSGTAWERQEVPPAGDVGVVTLHDAAAMGPRMVSVGVIHHDRPAIYTVDRSTWTYVEIDDPGSGEDALLGVAASGGTAWAVGSRQQGNELRTFAGRWNGTSFSPVPTPNVGAGANVLRDVAVLSPTDAWAVGWWMDGQVHRGLTLHWDGSAWRAVKTPDSGDTVLMGAAVRGSAVWAVGWSSSGDTFVPLALRWNGERWNAVPSPVKGGAQLTAAAGDPSGLMAVGQTMDADGYWHAAAWRYDGVSWTDVSVTASQPQTFLAGVTFAADGTPWAVGTTGGKDGSSYGSLVLRGCPEDSPNA